MANMKHDYYIYAHLKKDTGEVFYIGKGKHKRCREKHGRSLHWTNTVKKHGMSIQILLSGLTEISAYQAEKQIISSLRAQGVGLVNQTDGGDGAYASDRVDEAKKKVLEFVRNKKRIPMSVGPERSLYLAMARYSAESRDSYDPAFRKELLSYGFARDTKTENIKKIKHFIEVNKRLPRQRDPEEKHLYKTLQSYASPSSNAFDPDFRQYIKESWDYYGWKHGAG